MDLGGLERVAGVSQDGARVTSSVLCILRAWRRKDVKMKVDISIFLLLQRFLGVYVQYRKFWIHFKVLHTLYLV